MKLRALLLMAAGAAGALAADIDSAALLARVQSKVNENAQSMPRYFCRQKIERKSFARIEPRSTAPVTSLSGCNSLPDEGSPKTSGMTLALTDRGRLDVMLSDGKELFSWPGGRSFETAYPSDLLGAGFSGSGDFAGFAITVFSGDGVSFKYVGACPGSNCVRYQYDVPVQASHYTVVQPDSVPTRLGFHGSFDVDPQTAALLRLTVSATHPELAQREACDIRTRMTYTKAASGGREFLIPESTEHEYLAQNGSYAVNNVVYEACREYTAESVLKFDDDSAPAASVDPAHAAHVLPAAGSEIQLQLLSKIDTSIASAGDSLEATLVHPVPDAAGGTIPAGTVFRGHLTQLERMYVPRRQLILGVSFNTVVLNGAPVPLTLRPIGESDSHGRAVYSLPLEKKTVLDKRFFTGWRVVYPPEKP